AGHIGYPKNRIIGGSNIAIEKAPWQVYLAWKEDSHTHTCGGSLIRPDVVLTAAHCVNLTQLETYRVRVGSSKRNEGGQLFAVANVVVHQDYNIHNRFRFLNDIAVLRITHPVKIGPSAQTIALATFPPPAGAQALTTGWGRILPFVEKSPIILQGVNVTILSSNECSIFPWINKKIICAGSKGKTACRGDSGGALVVNNQAVGVVSTGTCDGPTNYVSDLEVRVGSSYMDFDGFLIAVSSIVCHEDYDSTSYDNDVALVVLSEPLDLRSYDSISYIELAKDVPTPGSQAFVTGWGYTEYGNPEVLQYLESKIVDPEKCKDMYTDYNTLTERMLCATAEERGTCRGDSGGALVLDNHQVGIVSWAGDCADPLFPTVYASVPALRDWIESTSNA
ncbi:hypothetical protein KR026_001275, partial [Drosophila bipectinata]